MNRPWDVVVIGAGAAGMMCAARLGQAGKRVALIDHSDKVAEKIRISGGGRCNFTNREVGVHNFVSTNPSFARSALKAYTSQDFIKWVKHSGIAYHEKHKGQLFCDRSSEDIIELLVQSCHQGHVQVFRPHRVTSIQKRNTEFVLETTAGHWLANAVVVATGGLAVPKIGATDFGLQVARQFNVKVIEPRPALVPLVFDAQVWAPYQHLAGVALPVQSRGSEADAPWFDEDLLFTHRGLSGPAVLQASTWWQPRQPLWINFSGQQSVQACISELQQQAVGSRALLPNWLAGQWPHVPRRLLDAWLAQPAWVDFSTRKVAELGKKHFAKIASDVAGFSVVPSGTEGYKKAEVMRGGGSTDALDAVRMEVRSVPGLFFIGEVVDVTGWLGGYNFQWAWSSAVAASRALGGV